MIFGLQNFLTTRPVSSRYPNFFSSTWPVPSRSENHYPSGPAYLSWAYRYKLDQPKTEYEREHFFKLDNDFHYLIISLEHNHGLEQEEWLEETS